MDRPRRRRLPRRTRTWNVTWRSCSRASTLWRTRTARHSTAGRRTHLASRRSSRSNSPPSLRRASSYEYGSLDVPCAEYRYSGIAPELPERSPNERSSVSCLTVYGTPSRRAPRPSRSRVFVAAHPCAYLLHSSCLKYYPWDSSHESAEWPCHTLISSVLSPSRVMRSIDSSINRLELHNTLRVSHQYWHLLY